MAPIRRRIEWQLVLDTHALIWYLEGSRRLGAQAKAALDNPDGEFVLPMIALAEAVYIVERGKTSISSARDLLDAVAADLRITLVPFDLDILERTLTLPSSLEMHDRQIMATALRFRESGDQVALMTQDRLMTSAGLIPIVW
jgi:PIN domain nuclease of toxin-antitoxin system